MRTEIGSEFWDIPTAGANELFPSDARWFRSGRSALTAILRDSSFRKAALPQWCCDSMIVPFLEAGVEVVFYPPFGPLDAPDADVALVMDYFGWGIGTDASGFGGTVIRDLTHSILRGTYTDADYYFGSLRKWAGLWTGGYAWGFRRDVRYDAAVSDYETLRSEAMEQKAAYICEKTDSKAYLEVFSRAEALLETPGVFPAAMRDVIAARHLDVELVRSRRRENARILLDALGDMALFPTLGPEDCPLFVPILVDNRDALRGYLIGNGIYCPVHWPRTPYHVPDPQTQRLCDRELSLVCDQRYTPGDMERMAALIKGAL